MKLPVAHLRHQVPVITSLVRAAMTPAKSRTDAGKPELLGRTVSRVLPPRPSDLVRDYVRAVGGDPQSYRNHVPPHMFCQWGFPLSAENLTGAGLPLRRLLNGGCRLEMRAPLPNNQPLLVTATIEEVDQNERRIVIRQRVTTGTKNVPEALHAVLTVIMPLSKGSKDRDKPEVPAGAREIAFWQLPKQSGLAFGMLTGDVNPIHWFHPYARKMGFPSAIVHGFATLARSFEGVVRAERSGDPTSIRMFEGTFCRPLPLPAAVGLYGVGTDIYVGDAPSGPAYMTGRYVAVDAKEMASE